jgi:hypothetical protein
MACEVHFLISSLRHFEMRKIITHNKTTWIMVMIIVPHGTLNLFIPIPISHKTIGTHGIIGKREIVGLDRFAAIASPSQNTTRIAINHVLAFISNFAFYQ